MNVDKDLTLTMITSMLLFVLHLETMNNAKDISIQIYYIHRNETQQIVAFVVNDAWSRLYDYCTS
jgi:hypothetical protein